MTNMENYSKAGRLFREREQVSRQIVAVEREFYAANSVQQEEIAPRLSALGAETVRIGREIVGLGFKVRVDRVGNNVDVFSLSDSEGVLSKFEVRR